MLHRGDGYLRRPLLRELKKTGVSVKKKNRCFTKEMGVFANPTSTKSPAKLRVAFEVCVCVKERERERERERETYCEEGEKRESARERERERKGGERERKGRKRRERERESERERCVSLELTKTRICSVKPLYFFQVSDFFFQLSDSDAGVLTGGSLRQPGGGGGRQDVRCNHWNVVPGHQDHRCRPGAPKP